MTLQLITYIRSPLIYSELKEVNELVQIYTAVEVDSRAEEQSKKGLQTYTVRVITDDEWKLTLMPTRERQLSANASTINNKWHPKAAK